ncbi:NIPSNAP family protein [Xanthomonas campestris]|uniref:NIPSNAP family protein n=1 Tax=Xanthomonas campestris TaxID=339 RepID=UPI001B7CE309|nr:NIPSNAP family protein [Xanthomonas campestris]
MARLGGQHHGCFLPSEGANTIALALFSFPSLQSMRAIGRHRCRMPSAWRRSPAKLTRCINSDECSFFRPVLG